MTLSGVAVTEAVTVTMATPTTTTKIATLYDAVFAWLASAKTWRGGSQPHETRHPLDEALAGMLRALEYERGVDGDDDDDDARAKARLLEAEIRVAAGQALSLIHI